MNTQTEILDKILEFCNENGEDPFEYQSDSAPSTQVFMSWCFGKGYISKEQFDSFLQEFENYEFFQLFGNGKDGTDSFVISENYGYDFLAEFIVSSDFYLDRFNKNFKL